MHPQKRAGRQLHLHQAGFNTMIIIVASVVGVASAAVSAAFVVGAGVSHSVD